MDRRRLLLRIALAAAPLLLAELGLRVAYAAGAGPAGGPAEAVSRIAANLTIAGQGSTESGPTEPGPLQNSTADPFIGWSGDFLWESFARGFGDDDTYDIVIVGGSVAAFVCRGGTDDLIEALQVDARFTDRDIRIHSLATGGRKQPQQLNIVSALFQRTAALPDAVINIDGFNELALSAQNTARYGAHPLQPAYFLWAPLMTGHADDPELLSLAFEVQRERRRAVALAATAVRWRVDASALLSTLVHARMVSLRARHGEASARYFEAAQQRESSAALTGAPFGGSIESAVELAVLCWAESSLSLHAICAQRSIPYLHVLQPTLLDEGSKPLTAEESRIAAEAPDAWKVGIRTGYPRLREEGARLRRAGVDFWDGSQVFAELEEALYYDACHFRSEGNYIVGRKVGREFSRSVDVE